MALPEISRSMLKNSLVLGLFAVVTVGVVAITQQGTAGRIATAEREAKAQALAQILPAGSYDNHLLDHPRLVFDPLLGNKTPTPAYLATLQGEPTAVILQATAPDGYSGSIFLLVGILADGRLAGVRVVGHKETPGLGDKIELAKSPWINGFVGQSLRAPDADGWAVKKDGGQFDQFAGATITPRAVVKAVHKTLQYFDKHRDELLAPVSSQGGENDNG
ncbi:electron transport complex subunit RsxG [Pseudomonas sp. R-28-1W-6]|uniref:electron transport complex subunit RsxG n=1 Tax=Pseudomonas sp. R-28-1W-6 TaxID=2650101 RepID=UPI0013661423|nr:electron transport complex subunit RsxG [Pseudomonas sp. R-28-1W-6]MWV13438.1 electron transport complex subunit RsxG [Pseudomonas sp. R-28-1W-6]